jgi:alpha-L-fucosidase
MTTTDTIRIRVLDARRSPNLSTVALFRQPAIIQTLRITRDAEGTVTIHGPAGCDVRYTVDGQEPDQNSALYTAPFSLVNSAVVKAVISPSADAKVLTLGEAETAVEFGYASARWSSEGKTLRSNVVKGSPVQAFDANAMTAWEHPMNRQPNLVIDLGQETTITGFTYLPEQKAYKGMTIPSKRGLVETYEFYVSADGKAWGTPVAQGRFGNIENNPIKQTIRLKTAVKGRYVRFVPKATVGKYASAVVAELEILGH